MLVHLAASCSFAFFFISSPFLFARCLREHMDERPAKRPGFEKPTCGDSRIYPRLLKQPHIRLLHSVPGAHADPRTSRCWDLRDDPPTFASAVLPQKNTVYEHGLRARFTSSVYQALPGTGIHVITADMSWLEACCRGCRRGCYHVEQGSRGRMKRGAVHLCAATHACAKERHLSDTEHKLACIPREKRGPMQKDTIG